MEGRVILRRDRRGWIGPVLATALAMLLAAGCGGGGGGQTATSGAAGGDLGEIGSRLQAAGYQASEGTPIAGQVSDGKGHEYRPDATMTIFKPNTGVYVTLSVSSDPKFIAAFKSQYAGQPVIVRGDHAYGITPASSGGSKADLETIVNAAEGQ
jgi:hypothetical protein